MAQPRHHVNSHMQECWEKLVNVAADCFPLLRSSPGTWTLCQSTFVFWINLAGICLHADQHLSLAFPFFIQRGFPTLQHRVGWKSTSLVGSMLWSPPSEPSCSSLKSWQCWFLLERQASLSGDVLFASSLCFFLRVSGLHLWASFCSWVASPGPE